MRSTPRGRETRCSLPSWSVEGRKGDARSFQEIVSAIRIGGGKVESEDKLRTGLGRRTLDVVKFGDHYGWLDNYPEKRPSA